LDAEARRWTKDLLGSAASTNLDKKQASGQRLVQSLSLGRLLGASSGMSCHEAVLLHFFVLNIEHVGRLLMEREVRGRTHQAKACKASGFLSLTRPITAGAHF
jgi:hypothetical protein